MLACSRKKETVVNIRKSNIKIIKGTHPLQDVTFRVIEEKTLATLTLRAKVYFLSLIFKTFAWDRHIEKS
jgi:hypothetical protein